MQPDDTGGDTYAGVKRLFVAAVELPPDRRSAYLDAECSGNTGLRQEVESLLRKHDSDDSLFPGPAPRADPLIGKRFGAWALLREIGRGGMGVVYLGERADGQFRLRVAVKVVRPGFLDEQTMRRFENERRMLAVLDHPNIIRLIDSGVTSDGIPFVVTDYVEGQPIDAFCESRGFSVRDRMKLFREVLSAVHYAHQNLVVHRDLKPSNILVTADGSPRLLDFGIARILRPEYLGGPMALTRTAMQPLTPEFASPEQLRGQPVTTASDIYSLGVILYRLLSGRHPFETSLHSMLELDRAVCETEPSPPSTLARAGTENQRAAARALRGDPDNIVLKAIRREPQLRYASAEHFSEDIRRWLEGYPISARPPGAWYRASRFAGRHRGACVAGAVFTLAIAASGMVAIRAQRLAERRFGELRNFANFVIRDFDNTLRQGITPARRRLNEEALRYLDGLAKEAGRDPVVQLDLAEGYTRAGDVLGNPNGSSLGDMQAAEESYRKAIAIAESSGSRSVVSRLALAKARIGLADVLWPRGRMDEAIGLYGAAARECDAAERSSPAKSAAKSDAARTGFRAWDHLMAAYQNKGDIKSAVASARQCLRYADEMGARDLEAYVHEREGKFLVLDGSPAEGEREVASAIATYEALGYANGPIPKRRTLAEAYKSLGDAQRAGGNFVGAEQSYRRSVTDVEQLAREDAKSASLQLDVGQANSALIELLVEGGKKAEARSQTVHALGLLRPIAEAPAATTWQMYYYAWLLVTTPFGDIADPATALRLAGRMMQKDPDDPEVLDLRARASASAGDIGGALLLEGKALAAKPLPDVRARVEREIALLNLHSTRH